MMLIFSSLYLSVVGGEIKDRPQIRCQKHLQRLLLWYIFQRTISEQEEDDDGKGKLPFCTKAA